MRRIYERLRGEAPLKLFFDVDGKQMTNPVEPEVLGNDVIWAVEQVTARMRALMQLEPHELKFWPGAGVNITSASRPGKPSLHMVFDMPFVNMAHLKRFIEAVKLFLEESCPDADAETTACKGRLLEAVDWGVYTNGRCMRMVGSSKVVDINSRSPRYLLPFGDAYVRPLTNYLISNVPPLDIADPEAFQRFFLSGITPPELSASPGRQTCAFQPSRRSCLAGGGGGDGALAGTKRRAPDCDAPDPAIEEHMRKIKTALAFDRTGMGLHQETGWKILRHASTTTFGVHIYVQPPSPRSGHRRSGDEYTCHLGGVHTGTNRVMITVDPVTGDYVYKCWAHSCAGPGHQKNITAVIKMDRVETMEWDKDT
jgi:GTP:adenosylcobinamide-phosphate guanylyltransferase